MNARHKPVYLLADSQLLFWQEDGGGFLHSIRWAASQQPPRAAYVGASNGDDPAFYTLFAAAMEEIGVADCRMVRTDLRGDDERFLASADIVLLSGGDVEAGWRAFGRGGMKELIERRREEGALLIGVSAGAVQLGLCGWGGAGGGHLGGLFDTFGIVPFIIGAHEEADDWAGMRRAVRLKGARGFGMPSGGGMVYHPDGSVEPVRYPLNEFSLVDERVAHGLLVPEGDEEIVEVPGVQ